MNSLISKLLLKKRTNTSAQCIRLYLARFSHLLRQYGQIIALCEDAADKQSGQYIFDKAYIVALADRAFEAAEGMVYDLNALSGEQYLNLYKKVETIRQRTAELLKAESSPSLAVNNEEELEYRALRKVRETICRSEGAAPSMEEKLTDPDFFGVLQSVLQAADDTIVRMVRSSAPPRPSTEASPGMSFPIDTCMVDLMNIPAVSGSFSSQAPCLCTDSPGSHEFLTAFFSPEIWRDDFSFSTGRQSTSLLGYHLAESMHVTIVHNGGYDLFNIFLGRTSARNYIYCRFPHGPAHTLAGGILKRLGFFVTSMEPELTGWIASQPLDEILSKLKMTAKLSAFLLQPSLMAAKQTEEDTIHLLGMHS